MAEQTTIDGRSEALQRLLSEVRARRRDFAAQRGWTTTLSS